MFQIFLLFLFSKNTHSKIPNRKSQFLNTMALYRNLGPINFQTQTDSLQIFSNQSKTLILQFKNSQSVNFEELKKIINLYGLILKKQDLLQIYQEKGKPYSILVHQTVRVGFQNINIDLLCRIIKELVTSILHCTQISKSSLGQLNTQLFFQIDGQLRYLYFPIQKVKTQEKCFQQLFSNILQFIQQFKNEKEVSHRLLLKKIIKCKSLQEILQQTDYFLNVYSVKQLNKSVLNSNSTQPLFMPKSKIVGNNYHSQNPYSDFTKNSNQVRRKYNIFKKDDVKSFAQTLGGYQNTWRKMMEDKNQSFHNSARTSFRLNSQAVHLDLKSKNNSNKNRTSNSIFKRTVSMSNSQKFTQRKTTKKKTNQSTHAKMKSTHLQPNFDSFSKKQTKNKQKEHQETIHESINLNQSIISKKIGSSVNLSQNIQQNKLKNMVHKSLQKWRKKLQQKQNFDSQIKQKFKQKYQKEQSTHIESSRKFDNLHQISKQSAIFQQKFIQQTSNKDQKTIKNTSQNVLSIFKEPKQQQNLVLMKQSRKKSEQKVVSQMKEIKKQFQKQKKDTSLQQIDFSKKPQLKSIQNSIVTDKNEPILNGVSNAVNKRTNNSDQSQTQRITYSKKSIKKQISLLEEYNYKKTQLQFIGTCVVETPKYLQNFQAIFWQLPMFFLYKKFYQLRLQLSDMFRNTINPEELEIKKMIDQQNQIIQESLIKLLKIVKKKVKKNYQGTQQLHEIQKTLNLDYTIKYESHIKEFGKIYLTSMVQATSEYPQLIMHQIQIMDSLLICFGKDVDVEKRNAIHQNQKQIDKYYKQRLQMMQGFIFKRNNKKSKQLKSPPI